MKYNIKRTIWSTVLFLYRKKTGKKTENLSSGWFHRRKDTTMLGSYGEKELIYALKKHLENDEC
jgi:hypothetical protein